LLLLLFLCFEKKKKMEDDSAAAPPVYVKLVSAEGHEFFMDRETAVSASQTMRLMLEGDFREAHNRVIELPDIAGYILEKVVQYLHYKTQHSNSESRIPEFVIEPELALELLIASKYLDC
jgi:hypothetical protein